MKASIRSRISESAEQALSLGRGVMYVVTADDKLPEEKWNVDIHSKHMSCGECGRSFEPLGPHNFSFNSALGWCTTCEGLGVQTTARTGGADLTIRS